MKMVKKVDFLIPCQGSRFSTSDVNRPAHALAANRAGLGRLCCKTEKFYLFLSNLFTWDFWTSSTQPV